MSGTKAKWIDSETAGAGEVLGATGSGGAAFGIVPFRFTPKDLKTVDSAWAVSATAEIETDDDQPSESVVAFASGVEQGIGLPKLRSKTGHTKLKLKLATRARTAPGAASTVIFTLYFKEFPDNAAQGAWSTQKTFVTVDIPTNEYEQVDEVTLDLSTLGMTAGRGVILEITRDGGTLSGDALVSEVEGCFF